MVASVIVFETLLLTEGLAPVEGITSATQAIEGVDGNEISLYIDRSSEDTGPLPGVLHIHGGGMTFEAEIGTTSDRVEKMEPGTATARYRSPITSPSRTR